MAKKLPLTRPRGITMMETTIVDGLTCRVGTMDSEVTRDKMESMYGRVDFDGARVLDVGGNIGGFVRFAVDRGAKSVLSIEPEPSNFRCLMWNTRDLSNVELVHACADLEDGESDLWLASGAGMYSQFEPGQDGAVISMLNPRQKAPEKVLGRGRFSIRVPTVDIRKLLRRFRPTVVKLDCEGAEYRVGRPSLMPSSTSQVVAELHVAVYGKTGFYEATSLAREYRRGWSVTVKPKITKSRWLVMMECRR